MPCLPSLSFQGPPVRLAHGRHAESTSWKNEKAMLCVHLRCKFKHYKIFESNFQMFWKCCPVSTLSNESRRKFIDLQLCHLCVRATSVAEVEAPSGMVCWGTTAHASRTLKKLFCVQIVFLTSRSLRAVINFYPHSNTVTKVEQARRMSLSL